MDWLKFKNCHHRHLRKEETAKIGVLFIVKLIDARPIGVPLSAWVEMIFGLHERYIIQYESNRAFTCPGLFKPVPMVRIDGLKMPRVIKQGKRLWVRFDEKYPNVIDLEAPIGFSEEPKIFQLSREQFGHIKMWLNPTSPKDVSLHQRALGAQQLSPRRAGTRY